MITDNIYVENKTIKNYFNITSDTFLCERTKDDYRYITIEK